MANVTVTTNQSNVTVNATTNTVNVSTTSSNIVVSNAAVISSTDVRDKISAVDLGGDGSLSYSNVTGIISYTGPSATETRAHFSATSPVLFDTASGVISIDPNALFSGKTTDDLAEGTNNLYYTNARVQAYVVDSGLDFNGEKVDNRVANLMVAGANLSYTYNDGANTLTLTQSLTTDDITEGTNEYFTNARANTAIDARLPDYSGSFPNLSDLTASNYIKTTALSIDTLDSYSTSDPGTIRIKDGSTNGGLATDRKAIAPEGNPVVRQTGLNANIEFGVNLGEYQDRFKSTFTDRVVVTDIVSGHDSGGLIGLANTEGQSVLAGTGNLDVFYQRDPQLEIKGYTENGNNAGFLSNPRLGFDLTTPAGEDTFYGERIVEPVWRNSTSAYNSTLNFPLWYGQRSLIPITENQAKVPYRYTIGEYNKAYHTAFAVGTKTNRIMIGDSTNLGNSANNTVMGTSGGDRAAGIYTTTSGTTPRLSLGYSNTTWGTDTDDLTLTTYGDIVDTKGDFALDGAITVTNSIDVTGTFSATGNVDTTAWVNSKVKTKHLVQAVNDLGTTSGAITVDCDQGGTVLANINADITGISLTNIQAGTSLSIVIRQDGVGNRDLDLTTTPSNWSTWKFISDYKTLSNQPNDVDIMTVYYDGANIFASITPMDAPETLALTGNISAGGLVINGEASITGNLEVQGNIDYVNVVDLLVNDQSITMNYGNATPRDAEIFVDRSGNGSNNTSLKWNETTDNWSFTNDGTTYYNLATSTSDLAEGTNLYYTTARQNTDFDTRLATKSTSDLSEGTNLYFTDARADARVNLQTGTNLDLSSKSTSDLSEGTNLYYTQGRFDSAFTAKSTSDLSEGTNLYYTDARVDTRVDTHLTGGTGIDYSAGTIDLADTAVTPGTYGDASNIPQLIVDQQGRITGVSDIAVSIPPSYGNVEVADFLANGFGSNTITTTGNIESKQNTIGSNVLVRDTVTSASYLGAVALSDTYSASIFGGNADDLIIDVGVGGNCFIDASAGLPIQISFDGYTGSGASNMNGVDFWLNGADQSGGAFGTYQVFTNAAGTTAASISTLGISPSNGGGGLTGNVKTRYNAVGNHDTELKYANGVYSLTGELGNFLTYDSVTVNPRENLPGGTVEFPKPTRFTDYIFQENTSNGSAAHYSYVNNSAADNQMLRRNGVATVQVQNNSTPGINKENGFNIDQAGSTANTLFSVPRFSMMKYNDVADFTTTNLGDLSTGHDPGAFSGVLDSKINRQRGYTLVSDPDNPAYYFSPGAAPHSVGSILFRTDPNSNVMITSGEPISAGSPYATKAPVSQGIIAFRTMQPTVAANSGESFPYNTGTDSANATVAFINDQFNIGNEDDSTKAYSFPKTPGANNTVLVMDTNNDLQFEDFEAKMDGHFEDMLRKYIGTINFIDGGQGNISGGAATTTSFAINIDGGNA
tara:strand:- start:104 stop:4414 length:4311 start_codon:yes stop_codon:yes gene_type:complete